jgi:competence ComEA-like helix-hairpin-helix protein
MKLDPVHTAIACLVLALAAAVLAARLGADTGPTPPLATEDWDLCAGFAARDGPVLGIAHGRTEAHLLARAIALLDLPGECAGLELPGDATRGGLVRYRLVAGGCEIDTDERLPGPQRLICGVGLDVNRDPAKDLELLPGIGPKKAGAIVESRERDGPFGSVADLARVKGIGEKTVERIRPWVDSPR